MTNDSFLTADEIFAIDNLEEDSLSDFLLNFTPEKRSLIVHIFSKNRANKQLKTIADENMAGIHRLADILKQHGIPL